MTYIIGYDSICLPIRNIGFKSSLKRQKKGLIMWEICFSEMGPIGWTVFWVIASALGMGFLVRIILCIKNKVC